MTTIHLHTDDIEPVVCFSLIEQLAYLEWNALEAPSWEWAGRATHMFQRGLMQKLVLLTPPKYIAQATVDLAFYEEALN
jgi:hypothetical protein